MSYFPRKFQITKVNRNSVHDLSCVTGIPGCQPTRMSPEEHRKAVVLGEDPHAALCPCVCVDDDSKRVVLTWKNVTQMLKEPLVWLLQTPYQEVANSSPLLLGPLSHPVIFIFKQERLRSLPCSSAAATSQAAVTPCFQVSNEYLAFLQTRHFIIQPKPEKSEKQATWDLGKS